MPSRVTIYVDSDFAGCAVTRKSTAGGAAMWGGKLLKTWSKTMAIIALSSGEAELGAVARGLAEGLGLRSVLADFGIEVDLEVLSDATAAIGMCRRLGLGRVRHLATADYWIQQRMKSGEVSLGKLPGTENPSDAMTKHTAASDLAAHCGRMSMLRLPGRRACVPAHEERVIGSLRASDDHDLDLADRPECPRRCRVPDRLLTAGVPALSSEPGLLWMRRPGGSHFQSCSR